MGRWTQYDEDDYRLPEGMKRIGYDSDTGCHYFKDSEGSIWQGEPGATYSEMTRVSSPRPSTSSDDDRDLEGAGTLKPDGYQLLSSDGNPTASKSNSNTSAYRTLFPFLLLIAASVLLVWRLVLSPASPYTSAPATKLCSKPQTAPYSIRSGDTCWDISKAHGISVEELKELNEKVQCDKLVPGNVVCVPGVVAPGVKLKKRRVLKK